MLIRLEIFPRFHPARTLINGFVSPLSDLVESSAITNTTSLYSHWRRSSDRYVYSIRFIAIYYFIVNASRVYKIECNLCEF